MALVLLPCDLPSWPTVQRHLNALKFIVKSIDLIDVMHKLHGLCCVSLDPDETDQSDIEIFSGFQTFLDTVLSSDEQNNFFQSTLPSLVNYALRLRLYKPINGLHYSLQQQADSSNLDCKFVASLVANAFFSTFPRRTLKTHPTLQDCNFSRFFVHLKSPDQQKKLRSLFEYFDRISNLEHSGKVTFTRKVMPKMSELDLDDWLQSNKLLCPVVVRHDDRNKHIEYGSLKVFFGNSRIGSVVMEGGNEQEDVIFGAFPELFVALLMTECIAPNEAFTVHGMLPIDGFRFGKWPQQNQTGRDGDTIFNTHLCLAESMELMTERPYLETSVVRELNKALTAFRQQNMNSSVVRLRPIGKSLSATPPKDLSPIREDVGSPEIESPDIKHNNITSGLVQATCKLDESMSTDTCTSTFEFSKTSQGSLTRRRGHGGELNTVFDTLISRPSVSTTTRIHRPLVQSASYLSRGDSEESFYADCRENLDRDAIDVGRFKSRCGGVIFQRSLKLICNPGSLRSGSGPVSNSSLGSPSIEQLVKVREPKSPLDGLTSMEASFVSCYTHCSSSSSSLDASFPEIDDEDDEGGFQSCSEELEEVCPTVCTDSRRTTITEEELQTEYEVEPTNWGRRVESGPVNCRRIKPSMSCTTESIDDSSYQPLDVSVRTHDEDVRRRDRCLIPVRRAPSTGFILDDDDDLGDEDLFVGDIQLEHEREWLAQFKNRGNGTNHGSLSRNDSSRYSFSSDFSSDLEDIYEHFEEKMTEGPVRDDPTIKSRPGDRLKRTLSDSLASFPRVKIGFPRSLSLTEKMQQEKLNIEQAKKRVDNNMDEYYDRSSLDPLMEDTTTTTVKSNPPLSSYFPKRNLVGISGDVDVTIEQNLCAVDESIALSLPLNTRKNTRLARLPSQLSVWWNYNSVYDFYVPLNPRSNSEIKNGCESMSYVCDADIDKTASEIEETLQRIPQGWPLRKMSSKMLDTIREIDILGLKKDTLLQVPIANARRSRSATNYEELAKMVSNDDSLDGIMKSTSLKDVFKKQRRILTDDNDVDEINCHRDLNVFELRHWPSVIDLNSEVTFPKTLNSESITKPSVASEHNQSPRQLKWLPRDATDANDEEGDDDTTDRPIETGNWTNNNNEDNQIGVNPQLMALVVWMAASQAEAPCVIYHTGGDQRIVKLSIVSRVLLDRRWSVGHIARAILSHYTTPGRRRSPDNEHEIDLLESLLPKETDI